MTIDNNCREMLIRLENAGFEAYFAGGCVRDTIMEREINDIDITTSALPEEIMKVFSDERVIPTGIKHGTVTVIHCGIPFEITTFRIDGAYSDSRRPDSVVFSRSLKDDVSRRDFTVNALAMDKNGNITDFFGGIEDIKNKVIRCVGCPEKRFSEDALRIMRAVRFSSQLGFIIEKDTSDALFAMRSRLKEISRERIREELDKLICGKSCVEVMLKYREIIAEIIPELRCCFDFEQHSKYHKYDVYKHTIKAVNAVPNDDLFLRRALLLHDAGKPETFKMDEEGYGHFKYHAIASERIAREVLTRLRYDRHTVEMTCDIIKRHSQKVESERQVRHIISEMGLEGFIKLMEMKKADNSAKRSFVLDENREIDDYIAAARRFDAENRCMSLSQLSVNGRDIMSLGYSGAAVGKILKETLELVIDEELPNEKDVLIAYIQSKKNS